MPINADKPHLWKGDVERSIDYYNDWFIRFAPQTYRTQRGKTTEAVLDAFGKTSNLTCIIPDVIRDSPGILPILRMVTAPPLARDRLMGLAHVRRSLIADLEGRANEPARLPSRMRAGALEENLQKLCDVLTELIDGDLLPWVGSGEKPSKQELDRAATVIADRMCGAASDPIIRNAQEQRQLSNLGRWLKKRGYRQVGTHEARDPYAMPPGTFTFRLPLPAGRGKSSVKVPIDCVIQPLLAKPSELPLLIEAKSAGDATNTNKRRKEEAQKFRQLKERYGDSVKFLLLLCGYFEPGYLGYEAAEGIDWVWEHRISDLEDLLPPGSNKQAETIDEALGTYVGAEDHAQEISRAEAQEDVDSRKSAEERNRLGQFPTPFPLACQIVARALEFLPPDSPLIFLEPALGTGVFFSALLHSSRDRKISSATGCEIDPAYLDIANSTWKPSGFDVLPCDFLDFASDPRNFGKFTLLCTNPPYVRHHHLPPGQKTRLQSLAVQRLGLRPSGLSGLYVYFVLMADSLLAEGGIASWLLPAEFLYVNYGRVIRDYLNSRVTLLAIHHFDPDEVQFDDALVSSCIATYRKKAPSRQSKCEMSYGGNYLRPREEKSVPLSRLRGLDKWTMPHFELPTPETNGPRLKDMVSVRRGIATGANDFFVIGEDTVRRYKIPHEYLKPILPGPRFVTVSVIESNPDGTPRIAGFRHLLDCTIPPDQVKRLHPGLWAYLEEGVARGLPERYICAQREVWYFQERREPSLFLSSYMGRSNYHRECPIRFFVNFSSALVTNVFLHLYPTPELTEAFGGDRERMIEFVNLLNAIPGDSVLQAGRAYGGGLHKVEPKELLEVRLPALPSWVRMGLKRQLLLL